MRTALIRGGQRIRVVPTTIVAAALMAASLPAAKAPDFTYRYPTQARTIVALRTWLDAQARRLRAAFVRDEASGRHEARKDRFTFNSYSASYDWKLVADTPRFLSLSLAISRYTGGAHGNSGSDSMIWDKATGMRRTDKSLFASPTAMATAVRPAFCRQLDAERRRKRGGDGKDGVAEFDKCIEPARETTVILGSSTHDRFDRIGFLIDPYVAGSYAEGDYEVTLPITPTIIAAMRPELRGYFKVAGTP